MSDLVARLRERRQVEPIGGIERVEFEDADALEAADHIEAQAKKIEELRAALAGIANECREAEREENFGGPVAHLAESIRLLAENAVR